MPRAVILGKKILAPYLATHWALKIGDTWYDVPGASKSEKGAPNKIQKSYGRAAASGAVPLGGGTVGNTGKSDQEILAFCRQWEREHPTYDVIQSNCQMFATDLAYWACEGACDMPPMESGNATISRKGGAFAVCENGAAKAHANTGHVEGRRAWLSGAVDGPRAGVDARAGEQGLGAFADASWVRAEGRSGVVGAHLDLNVNTGAGMRNGNAEASLLGFGVKVGVNGLSLNTPLGGLSFGSGRA